MLKIIVSKNKLINYKNVNTISNFHLGYSAVYKYLNLLKVAVHYYYYFKLINWKLFDCIIKGNRILITRFLSIYILKFIFI